MDYILYFFIYSVLGWCLETAYAFLINRRYVVRRTLLRLPACPVYGVGAVLLILTLGPVAENPLLVFCGGFLVASCAEYITEYFAENFLRVRLWDYRDAPVNLHGRVCAWFSACWGVAALLFFRFLEPGVTGILSGLSLYTKLILTIFGCLCFLPDMAATLRACRRFGRGEDDTLPQTLPAIQRLV